MSSAKIIENVKYDCEASDSVAYFYFSFRNGIPADSSACLRSLILQLSDNKAEFPVAVQNLYDHSVDKEEPLNTYDLLEVLLSLSERQRRTFIVLDALDEAADKAHVLEILSLVAERKLETLHVLVSSRLELEIKRAIDPIATDSVHMAGPDLYRDITLYVQQYLEDHPRTRKLSGPLKRQIEDWLVHESDGRYLRRSKLVVCLARTNWSIKILLGIVLPCDASTMQH